VTVAVRTARLALAACVTLAACATTPPARPAASYTVLLESYHDYYKRTGPSEMEMNIEVSADVALRIENEVGSCVEQGMQDWPAGLRFVSAEEFGRVVFPGVARENLPRSPESLLPVRTHPEFRRRAATLGLRYLVLVTGRSEEYVQEGGGCSSPFGCAFSSTWTQVAQLRAVVLDVSTATTLHEVGEQAAAKRWAAFIVLIPMWWPPLLFWQDPPQPRACRAIGREVARAMAQHNPPP